MYFKELSNDVDSDTITLKDIRYQESYYVDDAGGKIILKNTSGQHMLSFLLQENAVLNFKLILSKEKSEFRINAELAKNAKLTIEVIDFYDIDSDVAIHSCLDGEFSSSDVRFAVVANNKKKKKYNVTFTHSYPNTYSSMTGNGVSLGKGSITMKGVSTIEEDCIKSEAHQNVRIVLFDKESKGHGSPILKTYCDDIVASHACAIGSLKEEDFFYLLSRGIDEAEARKLLTLSYLQPTIELFKEADQEVIKESIKGTIL
ncbi:MAG TPA: SufD family Fe-S cluster assembly protein [Candidatus Onthovivens sp.]|nr:SufD family Fe-S cluster assembly protein [Candidatus Onthovivens sp.]